MRLRDADGAVTQVNPASSPAAFSVAAGQVEWASCVMVAKGASVDCAVWATVRATGADAR